MRSNKLSVLLLSSSSPKRLPRTKHVRPLACMHASQSIIHGCECKVTLCLTRRYWSSQGICESRSACGQQLNRSTQLLYNMNQCDTGSGLGLDGVALVPSVVELVHERDWSRKGVSKPCHSHSPAVYRERERLTWPRGKLSSTESLGRREEKRNNPDSSGGIVDEWSIGRQKAKWHTRARSVSNLWQTRTGNVGAIGRGNCLRACNCRLLTSSLLKSLYRWLSIFQAFIVSWNSCCPLWRRMSTASRSSTYLFFSNSWRIFARIAVAGMFAAYSTTISGAALIRVHARTFPR